MTPEEMFETAETVAEDVAERMRGGLRRKEVYGAIGTKAAELATAASGAELSGIVRAGLLLTLAAVQPERRQERRELARYAIDQGTNRPTAAQTEEVLKNAGA